MNKALEAARAAVQARKDAGEVIERKTPAEKAAANPKSKALAIVAKCFDCVGGPVADHGFRKSIRDCPSTKCALHTVRPYQRGDDSDVDPIPEVP